MRKTVGVPACSKENWKYHTFIVVYGGLTQLHTCTEVTPGRINWILSWARKPGLLWTLWKYYQYVRCTQKETSELFIININVDHHISNQPYQQAIPEERIAKQNSLPQSCFASSMILYRLRLGFTCILFGMEIRLTTSLNFWRYPIVDTNRCIFSLNLSFPEESLVQIG